MENIPNSVTIRRRHRLTQAEFAKILGVSLSCVKNWERRDDTHKRHPYSASITLLRIADKNIRILKDLHNLP